MNMFKNIEVLSKLEFSEEERVEIKNYMNNMVKNLDKLNELDTENIEPMSHIFPINNVFREDIVKNSNDRENMLSNAPDRKNGSFRVPKTID
ncbi:MAG: Asp-tRNA(Asn)/Glu-tRNA(Gln) amidotransferase subunit GatC [Clostridiales bacterium]|nr:Asp-tRNA(Asn)/Glu-tRNA(Gln) amidotransferase subunit GatC [Clostridiales bacterium]